MLERVAGGREVAVPTRDQVRLLLNAGLDNSAVAERLGIPAREAYLIATAQPADGSEGPADGEPQGDGLLASGQQLANLPEENSTGGESVH